MNTFYAFHYRVFFFIFLLSAVCLTNANAQRRKKEQEAKPAVVEPPKPAVAEEKPKADTTQNRPMSASDVLTNHFARKYAIAIQWNDYDVAKSALYDVIAENPQNDSLIYDLAYFYYQNQKYASAALVTNELLKRNPKNIESLEISAVSLENMGATENALQRYESLYLLENSLPVLYKMAFLQYQLKRWAECETSVNTLLTNAKIDEQKVTFNDAQNKPKEYKMKVALFNLLGMVYKDKGDKVKARDNYNKALALAPDFQPAKKNLTELK